MDKVLEEQLDRLMKMEPPEEARDDEKYIARRNKWIGALGTHLNTLIAKVEGDSDAELALMSTIGALKSLLRRENLWVQYDKRVNRIRKTSTITKENILDAESIYETRAEEAEHLGISKRHLRTLRKRLLG